MARGNFLFTSESVSEGHPDKVCDQISDAILDEMLAQDPNSRVACEVLAASHQLVIAGEVRSSAKFDIVELARQVVKEIGYDDDEYGFSADSMNVMLALHQQSEDIAVGVDEAGEKEQGAGDQGLMFGYATNQTEACMPFAIHYSHRILEKLSELRKNKTIPFLKPDAKSQLTVEYENWQPKRVKTVVLSTQHAKGTKQSAIKEAVIEEVIKKVLPKEMIDGNTEYHINPTGIFEIGGPYGDCGLTGRKIIVDTYGGWGRHGGGAFSGKDPSKVDRSAAYMARHIAKSVILSGLAESCEIQLSYAIGIAEPLSVYIDTFGTGKGASDEELAAHIRKGFPLQPAPLIKYLDLLKPRYRQTAAYGHFGRTGGNFSWESDKGVAIIKG